MNERTLATGLFLLPFLYVAARVVSLFPASALGVYFAVGLSLAIALMLARPEPSWQMVAVSLDITLAVLVAVSLLESKVVGDLASQLTVGVLIGLPFLVSALAWRERSGPAHRALALAFAIVIGTALLATREGGVATVHGDLPTNFVEAFFAANVNQIQGLADLVAGVANPNLPLRAVFDGTFAALCALAVAGVILVALRPRSGLDEPLPVAARMPVPSARGRVDRLVPFSSAQRAVFESRSPDEPPTGAWAPGLASIVFGAMVAGGFIAVAFATPLYTPLIVALGVTAELELMLIAISRPRDPARIEVTSASSTAGGAAPSAGPTAGGASQSEPPTGSEGLST
ncbi:MAG: hypothetical protein L3K10_00505 [Thermoplasmata archaeon]|nr:hypothetical protein [Thermoplasmata archaeon]